MFSKKSTNNLVGLEIEAGSIAAAEVGGNGVPAIGASGIVELAPGAFSEGEVLEPDVVASALRELFNENRLSKQVRLGIANQKVAVRSIRLPLIERPDELEAAVRFQAADHIPMPLDQAVMDYRVVSKAKSEDGGTQMDVIVVAARSEMVNVFIDTVRRAGLKPVGIDLSAFGMIRALAVRTPPPDPDSDPVPVPATLYCGIGDGTNLAVARGKSCLFSRVSAFGTESIATQLVADTGLTIEHARQWLTFVGLGQQLETLEGDPEIAAAARRGLEVGASRLVDELRLSLDYYGQQESSLAVERVVLGGTGSTIRGLGERLSAGLSLPVEAAVPNALASMGEVRAARMTMSFGLALEE